MRSALLILFHLFPRALCSLGDSSPSFRLCLDKCSTDFGCPRGRPLDFHWTIVESCFSCRQHCIWTAVDHFLQRGHHVPQFFGKWPFIPVTYSIGPLFFSIQEPASVLFSLLNAYSTRLMMGRIRAEVPLQWAHRSVWLLSGWIGLAAWTGSALYHTFDHWATEMADYCCAFALILYSLYAIGCTMLLGPLKEWLPRTVPVLPAGRLFSSLFLGRPTGHDPLLALLFALFYALYMNSMYGKPRFDYALHIRCCVCLGLATGCICLGWILCQCWRGLRRRSLLFLLAAFSLAWFSAAFDALLDFPPLWWLFDAHSLFHLFSIPVPLLWASYICAEANIHQLGEQTKAD